MELEHALRIAEAAFGNASVQFATCLNNRGANSMGAGEFAAARSDFQSALDVALGSGRPDAQTLAKRWLNIGLACLAGGQYEEASHALVAAWKAKRANPHPDQLAARILFSQITLKLLDGGNPNERVATLDSILALRLFAPGVDWRWEMGKCLDEIGERLPAEAVVWWRPLKDRLDQAPQATISPLMEGMLISDPEWPARTDD
jgi:tetratricopeptide (TPR) repeat protein